MNRYVEVTRRTYFERLASSFAGIAVGFVLVVASIALLWWNEGRAVKAQRGLDEATKLVVDIDPSPADPANNGKLVHLSGEAVASTPVRDGDLSLVFAGVVVVARTVEMYQWIEDKRTRTVQHTGGSETTETTYDYRLGWSADWKNASGFKQPAGHANPPMPLQSTSWAATDAKLGAFTLQREALLRLKDGVPFKPQQIPEGWKDGGEFLYRGNDPAAPQLGDLRVGYTIIASPAPVSIMARQMGPGFETYEMPNGYPIFFVRDGARSAEAMIKEEREFEVMITWLLRAGGVVAMWLGFCLIMGPLKALANVLPFLADVAGFAVAVVAAGLALPIGVGLIGIAWLFYRPLIGAVVVVVAIAAGYALVKYRHRIAPPPAERASAA